VQARRAALLKQLLDCDDVAHQQRLVAELRSLAPDEYPAANNVVVSSDGDADGSDAAYTDRLAAKAPIPSHLAPSRALPSAPPASVARADGGGERVRWEDPVQQPSVLTSFDSAASAASLAELLGREAQVARYAETLKDILKQVPSSADSKDQFKSLQKVL
jgi:hypothetical protein